MNLFSKLISLDTLNKNMARLKEDQYIENRKKLNRILSDSKKAKKKDRCFFCDNAITSYCNSHTIPRFIIENISEDGEVFNSNQLVGIPLLDKKVGVNKTGTFHLICRNCDGKIFSDYENPENYHSVPTHKMLNQIALKNYLKSIDKKLLEKPMYDNVLKMNENSETIVKEQQKIINLDFDEYLEGYLLAKKALKDNIENVYNLFYYMKLDYVVPVVFQSNIALLYDFENNLINDIYNHDKNYKIENIHVAILPCNGSTTILMFVEDTITRYSNFINQFSALSKMKQLQAINYIVFSLSEDVYLSKKVDKKILKNRKFKKVSSQSTIYFSLLPFRNPYKKLLKKFGMQNMTKIPNLLSKELSININKTTPNT